MELLDEATVGGVIFSLILALGTYLIANRCGFFKLPEASRNVPVSFSQTAYAFLSYLVFAWVLFPIAFILVVFALTGEPSIKKTPAVWLTWAQAATLWAIFSILLLYTFLTEKGTRRYLFWGDGEKSVPRFFKACAMGIVACLISYPFVLLTTLVAKAISVRLWGDSGPEQVAVHQLKLSTDNHWLYSLMAVAIVFLGPFVEELLFRGFLQNLLKRHFGRTFAIASTAILFACAHFSKSQGIGNFQLIISLLVLAFFLGYIYERERSLWASFALHTTFNGMTVLLIFFDK